MEAQKLLIMDDFDSRSKVPHSCDFVVPRPILFVLGPISCELLDVLAENGIPAKPHVDRINWHTILMNRMEHLVGIITIGKPKKCWAVITKR